MDYDPVHYGLLIRPKWIISPSNMDYRFVQYGLQIHLLQLNNIWD